jgi:hypothetical protein
MDAKPGVNPLTAEERIYRRIAKTFVGQDGLPTGIAFKPTDRDVDGLSLSREVCGDTGCAATGKLGKQFHVATTTVAAVETAMPPLNVFADADDHALIPELNAQLKSSKDQTDRLRLESWMQHLRVQFCKSPLSGPFEGEAP